MAKKCMSLEHFLYTYDWLDFSKLFCSHSFELLQLEDMHVLNAINGLKG